MTAEDAAALLKRMQLAYKPPPDIRGNPDAIAERLRIYRNALRRFGADVLDQAWLKAAVGHRYPQWPDCPDIVKAAEHFHALAHPKAIQDDNWVEKAVEMTDSYVRRFMKTSQYAVRARQGNYAPELRRYVTECAWVQAQLIAGRKDMNYCSGVLFGQDKPDDEFFTRAREQAETGSIRVRVPLALIERWREGAEKGRPRYALDGAGESRYGRAARLSRRLVVVGGHKPRHKEIPHGQSQKAY